MLGAAAGAILGSAISAGTSAAAADKAWDRQKKMAKRQIQWRAQDLEKAGINRILAGGYTSGGSGAPMAKMPDFAAGFGSTAQGMAATKKAGPQAEQAEAAANNLAANTAKANAETITEGDRQHLIRQQASESTARATGIQLENEGHRQAQSDLYGGDSGKWLRRGEWLINQGDKVMDWPGKVVRGFRRPESTSARDVQYDAEGNYTGHRERTTTRGPMPPGSYDPHSSTPRRGKRKR